MPHSTEKIVSSKQLSLFMKAIGIDEKEDDYRPVHLCSFPADRDLTREHSRPDHAHYRRKGLKLVKDKHIRYKEITTTGWYSEIHHGSYTKPEVLVQVDNHLDFKAGSNKYARKWEDRTAQRIFSLLATSQKDAILEPVKKNLSRIRYYPLQRSDSIYSKWSEIRSAIMAELDVFDWYSLGCFKINRIPITPVISIKTNFITDIQENSQQIQDILVRLRETDTLILFTRH